MFFPKRPSSPFNDQLFQTLDALHMWQKFRLRLFVEGIFTGLLAGLAIALFRFLLERAESMREFMYHHFLPPDITAGDHIILLYWMIGIAFAAYLLYRMCLYAPMAGGSGIPQVKGVILGAIRMRWLRILWVKILGGALAIGMGLSLGREGPSIQIGAVTAQGLSRSLGRTRLEERFLITSGASAGLAAAFNAPLAGMMFALEELHRNFSGAVLLPTMTSAITATLVTRFFFGMETSFQFGSIYPLPTEYLLYVILIAITAGFVGILFNYGLLHISSFYSLPFFRNQYTKILFALLTAFVLGITLPEVLGGGNQLVNILPFAHFGLYFLLLLFAGKYILTVLSYGCGVPGGFFLPLLVLGALLGAIESEILISLHWMEPMYRGNMVIIGMVSLFAASIRSPITGTVLILEMTGDFTHLMVLALASAIGYITAELLKGAPIYDALLQKSLNRSPDKSCEEERNIVVVPVGSGSILENKKLSDIPKLPHTLILEIKRGDEHIIPDANTRILAGDFLYYLTHSKNSQKLKSWGEPQAPKFTQVKI